MNSLKLILISLIATILVSCATFHNSLALFGASATDRQQNAAIAGGYSIQERGYLVSFLQITAINGKEIDASNEYLVPPGKYKISMRFIAPGDDTSLFNQTALTWNFEEDLEVQAGHTYIPKRIREGNDAKIYFEDAGLNFRPECLPLPVRTREVNKDNSIKCAL